MEDIEGKVRYRAQVSVFSLSSAAPKVASIYYFALPKIMFRIHGFFFFQLQDIHQSLWYHHPARVTGTSRICFPYIHFVK